MSSQMDVDQGAAELGTLKRSNSAPMLNNLCKDQNQKQNESSIKQPHEAPVTLVSQRVVNMPASRVLTTEDSIRSPATPRSLPHMDTDKVSPGTATGSLPTTPTQPVSHSLNSQRIRRFSSGPGCPPQISRVPTPRIIDELRQQETVMADRETQHERDTQMANQMSRSWIELAVTNENESVRRPRSFSDALHICTNQPTTKQQFSPSMQAPVSVNTHGPASSPTRALFSRSISPIAVSRTGIKRRHDSEGLLTPPKRLRSAVQDLSGLNTPPQASPCSMSPAARRSRSSLSSPATISPLAPPPQYSFSPLRDDTTDGTRATMSDSGLPPADNKTQLFNPSSFNAQRSISDPSICNPFSFPGTFNFQQPFVKPNCFGVRPQNTDDRNNREETDMQSD